MKLFQDLLPFFIQKRFLKTTFCPLSTSSLRATTPNSSSFTVQFLVNSCGLPFKSALSASQKLHLHENNIQKTQALLLFLKSHNFDDTQIANLIKKRPTFLLCRVESNLKPKFEFLIANGFAGKLLPQLVLSNPVISGTSLVSNMKLSVEFLKSLLGSSEKVAATVQRASWLLHSNVKVTMQPNVGFLIKEGVPLHRLTKLIILYPRSLLHKLDRVVYTVNTVKTLGLQPGDNMFIHALAVRLGLTDKTWNKKIEVMKSLDWSEKEILGTFKRYPQILGYSEKKVRSSVDFFINNVELGREILLAFPCLLCLSVDKRIRPRFNVINLLKSKDLIKGDNKKIPSLLIVSEEKFLKNYVVKYSDDVPGLLEEYLGTKERSTTFDG